jgi:hypothetical protein
MSITFLNTARESKKEWMAENERSVIVLQGEPGSLRTVAINPSSPKGQIRAYYVRSIEKR